MIFPALADLFGEQGFRLRRLPQPLFEAGVVNCHADDGGQQFQRGAVVFGKAVFLQIQHLQDADHLLVGLERDGQNRAQRLAGALIHAGEMARIREHVRHDYGLPALRDHSGNALPRRQPPAAHGLAVRPNRVFADEFIGFRVAQPDGAGIHFQ